MYYLTEIKGMSVCKLKFTLNGLKNDCSYAGGFKRMAIRNELNTREEIQNEIGASKKRHVNPNAVNPFVKSAPPEKPKLRELWEGSTAPVRPKAKAGKIIVEGFPLNLYINLRVLLGFVAGCVLTALYFIS